MTRPAAPDWGAPRHDGCENQWIPAAKAGSDAAFSRLVQSHQGAVRGFLRRVCGDPGRADDIAQEAFLTAWTTLRRFDGRSSFRAWVCGIAYRKHLSDRRASFRALKRDGTWAEQREREREGVETASEESRLSLQSAMIRLPDEQRAAVALCLAADFSHAEAAEALGVPLGTVKSHVARGRVKLLELIGGRDD